MVLMIITLVCGLILSAWVILDALRPRTDDGTFVAPRRKEPNRVWDTVRTERPLRPQPPESGKTELNQPRQLGPGQTGGTNDRME
jgi:hypothetical protein